MRHRYPALLIALTLTGCGGVNDQSATATQPGGTPQTQRAAVGQALNFTSPSGGAIQVAVTGALDPVTSPNQYDQPAPGTRWVGVQLSITNTGRTVFQELLSATTTLSGTGGQQLEHQHAIAEGPCIEPAGMVTVTPGTTQQVCLPFVAPANVSAQRFQMIIQTQGGQLIGEWVWP